ncbi:hypothetical protein CspHIS471_0406850 [Cutaneotrichosporon sp. HIS471]|nr:hypothetical protein CspHIS471_0406850 [Cutaneotrichosporon sp. HIS471]
MPVITVEVTKTASATAISKLTSAATAKATNGLSPGSGLLIALSVCGLLAFLGFLGIVLPLAWNDYGQWCFPLCSVWWSKDEAQTAEPTRENRPIIKTIGSLFRGSSSTTSSTPSEDSTANEKHTRNSVTKLRDAFTSVRYSVTRRSEEPARGSGSGSSANLTETASADSASFDSVDTHESFGNSPRLLDNRVTAGWLPFPPPTTYTQFGPYARPPQFMSDPRPRIDLPRIFPIPTVYVVSAELPPVSGSWPTDATISAAVSTSPTCKTSMPHSPPASFKTYSYSSERQSLPPIPVNINAGVDALETGVVGARTGVIETNVDFDASLDLLEALAIIPEEGQKQKEKKTESVADDISRAYKYYSHYCHTYGPNSVLVHRQQPCVNAHCVVEVYNPYDPAHRS